MSTELTNIEQLETIAGELTDIVKVHSLAYQVCGIQRSETSTPSVFGVKKNPATNGFTIVKTIPEKVTTTGNEGFTEEMIDDVFALFGTDARDYLKQIAANEIADAVDVAVLAYMKALATEENAATYDFGVTTDHREIIHNLMLKINKSRVTMAKALKRGLPKILIVSGGIASLLITNKMVSGNDSDYVAGGKDNIKFIGKMGDMMVYHDIESTPEYVMIAHKSAMPGDASVILVPIRQPRFDVRRDHEDGQPRFHFKQKHAYSRNPLDIEALEAVKQVTTVTFANFDISDEITISGIGGTPVMVPAAVDITTTVDDCVTEITARTGETVVATNVGGVLTLTSTVAGVAFTPVVDIVDAGLATVTTGTIETTVPNVSMTSSIFTHKFDCTLTGFSTL
jgi:hypothetical protein